MEIERTSLIEDLGEAMEELYGTQRSAQQKPRFKQIKKDSEIKQNYHNGAGANIQGSAKVKSTSYKPSKKPLYTAQKPNLKVQKSATIISTQPSATRNHFYDNKLEDQRSYQHGYHESRQNIETNRLKASPKTERVLSSPMPIRPSTEGQNERGYVPYSNISVERRDPASGPTATLEPRKPALSEAQMNASSYQPPVNLRPIFNKNETSNAHFGSKVYAKKQEESGFGWGSSSSNPSNKSANLDNSTFRSMPRSRAGLGKPFWVILSLVSITGIATWGWLIYILKLA